MVHIASFDEKDVLHVVDVWESQELMDNFVKTQLAPAMQKLNIPFPKVEIYPVHNMDAYSGIEKYILK
jgi:hypothetical protein